MLQGILRWAVPDVSGRLLKRITRENFLLREHIIDYEKQHAMQQAQMTVNGLRQRTTNTQAPGYDDATTFV